MWPWRKERSPAIAISSSASRRACRKKNGLQRIFDQKVDVDWSDDSLEIIKQTVLKKYCSLIHGQPVLEAVLKLKRDSGLTADDVESVLCDIFQSGFDIAGGGAFGPKDRPWTKEQADYHLKYLIAAALL